LIAEGNPLVKDLNNLGFIIMNADKSMKGTHAQGADTFMSNTQFCLKLFRRDNKEGFIKVLSSNPVSISPKLPCLLKACYINQVVLYPRVRKEIKTIDQYTNLKVEEVAVDMSPKMAKMQHIIITLLHT